MTNQQNMETQTNSGERHFFNPLAMVAKETESVKESQASKIQNQAVKIQQMAKRIVELEQQLKDWRSFLEGCISSLVKERDEAIQDRDLANAHVDKFCDEVEAQFDATGRLASPEFALDYLAAAQRRAKAGRTNNRVVEIQGWVDTGWSISNLEGCLNWD